MENLPKLIGSEKQVAWASDIREKFFQSVEKIKELLEKHGEIVFQGEDVTEEEYFFIVEKLKKEESAEFWINYRFFKGLALVEELKEGKMKNQLKDAGIYKEVDW